MSAEELLAEADIAMYDAKEAGRDGAVVFSVEGRDAQMAGRLEWVERIRHALAEDRFVLHGQRDPVAERRRPARARSCCCGWWPRTAA